MPLSTPNFNEYLTCLYPTSMSTWHLLRKVMVVVLVTWHLYYSSIPGSGRFLQSTSQTRSLIKNYVIEQNSSTLKKISIRDAGKLKGHTLHNPTFNITRQAFTWNLPKKRRQPTNTWCQYLEADSKQMGKMWEQL